MALPNPRSGQVPRENCVWVQSGLRCGIACMSAQRLGFQAGGRVLKRHFNRGIDSASVFLGVLTVVDCHQSLKALGCRIVVNICQLNRARLHHVIFRPLETVLGMPRL